MLSPSGMPRRVIYVHRTKGQGVEGVHIEGIRSALERVGFSVDVVSPVESAGKTLHRRKRQALTWLSAHAPEFLFELAELFQNLQTLLRLRSKIHTAPVAFIYERYAIFAVAAAALASRNRIPLILEVNYTSRSPLVRRRTRILRPVARWLDRWVLRRAHLIAVVSTALKCQLQDDYNVPESRLIVVPNAADPTRFHPGVPAKVSINGIDLCGKCVIGFVGSFAPWHGIDLLLNAFRRVAHEVPDAHLVLIGSGPEKATIERRALSSDLVGRVTLTGDVPNELLPEYVARFDIAVLPDTNDYGSPMKLFEYMAMGKPVVAPDYSPVADVLEHEVNGLVFRRRDEASLTRALVTLCTDQLKASTLGRAGRASVMDHHTWQVNVSKILDALDLTEGPPDH